MLYDHKKLYKQKKRIKKLLALEQQGLISEGTAHTSLVSWLANANRGNARKEKIEMGEYYERIKRTIKEDNP